MKIFNRKLITYLAVISGLNSNLMPVNAIFSSKNTSLDSRQTEKAIQNLLKKMIGSHLKPGCVITIEISTIS